MNKPLIYLLTVRSDGFNPTVHNLKVLSSVSNGRAANPTFHHYSSDIDACNDEVNNRWLDHYMLDYKSSFIHGSGYD